MECHIIKLVNGETLLASIINADETHLYVNNPIQLQFTASDYGTVLSSTYWIPIREMINVFPIKSDHVIVYSKAGDYLNEFYGKAIAKMTSPDTQPEPDPEEEIDKEEKIQQYRNKLRLVRAIAANTVH